MMEPIARAEAGVTFTPGVKSRAYKAVLEQVCDGIAMGVLRVGDLLPSERDLAAQLEISRTSVREAMNVLADAGIVSRRQGTRGGTQVISDEIPMQLLADAVELSHKRIMDLLEVRLVLEQTSASLAAARATEKNLESLDEIVRRCEEAGGEEAEIKQLFKTMDARFHLAVAQATQNDVLFKQIRSITAQFTVAIDMIPALNSGMLDQGAREVSSMQEVVQAIKGRNPDEARLAMVGHLSYMRPIVEQYFQGR